MKSKEHRDDDKESDLNHDADDLNDEIDIDSLFLIGYGNDFLD